MVIAKPDLQQTLGAELKGATIQSRASLPEWWLIGLIMDLS